MVRKICKYETGANMKVANIVKLADKNAFDVQGVRNDFSILNKEIYGKPLIYLDNSATTQKPNAVIEAMQKYYLEENSNVHRGIHFLSQQATANYENARAKAQQFINARDVSEIVFVRGTTEAINLVSFSFGRQNIKNGDEIIISEMEHHSNIVPWQILCKEIGAILRVAPINDDGELILDEFKKLLNHNTKLVAITHISNALGTINPVKEIIELAHKQGVHVLIDGAQAVPHMKIDVQELDCDFYAFSGHKIYGPTGIGVLYAKAKWLEAMPPYQSGGDMISSVTFAKTTYNKIPYKFEAGTPNIAGAIGLGVAIDYVNELGLQNISVYENTLLKYAIGILSEMPQIKFIGTAKEKAAVISFVYEDVHPHDVGTILDREGIAIRTGHHCAQPVMERFGVPATCRASLALYNTKEEIDALAKALAKVREVFK